MSRTRTNWLVAFLWLCCAAWGIGLGAKLFELQVVIGASAANPPGSLSLLPYGPKYPSNPGDFYQPLSVLLVLGLLGRFVLGWRGPQTFKRWSAGRGPVRPDPFAQAKRQRRAPRSAWLECQASQATFRGRQQP